MRSSGHGHETGPSPVVTQLINLDEAWAQPLGYLDLVTLEIEGAVLEPVFYPTIVQYEAFPTPTGLPRPAPAGAVPQPALDLQVTAAPARRSTPLEVASATAEIEALGQHRFRLRGAPGREHHLTITVGWPAGPSRTTVVAVRPTPVLPRTHLPGDAEGADLH